MTVRIPPSPGRYSIGRNDVSPSCVLCFFSAFSVGEISYAPVPASLPRDRVFVVVVVVVVVVVFVVVVVIVVVVVSLFAWFPDSMLSSLFE